MNRARLFCLVILLAVWPCVANCLAAEWVSVRTPHFHLISHAPATQTRQTAQQLEIFRAALEQVVAPEQAPLKASATVLLFQDEAEFKPFNPYNGAGYFLKDRDVNYIVLAAQEGDKTWRTAYHEYAHLILGQRFAKLPRWLDEGLAEYYSSLRVDGGKIYLGGPLPGHLFTLNKNAWLPWEQIFTARHQSANYRDDAQRSVFYAQAWFLVHCLNTRPEQFSRFLALLDTGTPALEALPQAFAMSLEELTNSARVAFTARHLPARVFQPVAPLTAPAAWPAVPVTEAEALAHQGDLLRHLEDLPAAETKLAQALALDARQPHALAMTGLLRARQRRFAEARTLLQAARQAAPDNYLYHFYFAQTLSHAPLDENNFVAGYYPAEADAMRDALRQAIRLAPGFSESYALYAFINLVQRENLDEAEEMAQEAVRQAPQHWQWRTTLARILLQRRKFAPAREAAAQVCASPAEAVVRDQARQVLNAIQRAEEELAQREERKKRGPEFWEPTDGTEEIDVEKVSALLLENALRRALRPVGAGEARIQGLLTALDCDPGGATYLVVKAESRVYKLRVVALPQVSFRAFAPGLSGPGRQMTCGPRTPANPAVVTFRPLRDAKNRFDGEAVAVEFVPEKFRLEP